jgi:hypothetical protein
MTTSDQISYGRAARLRAAVAELAADIADSAAGMVTTYADGYAHSGELAAQAHQIAADARELERLAVACERTRGASWDALAEGLGLNSRQAAHDRYSDTVKQIADAITECWLLGDDPRTIALPDAAANTAESARLLDRWVLKRSRPAAHLPADHPGRDHPASAGLKPMDSLEHSSLVLAGTALITDARAIAAGWSDSEQADRVRKLELGLARRKVELYERMLAERFADISHATDPDMLRDLLAGARARLAELTDDAYVREHGGDDLDTGHLRDPEGDEAAHG